MNQEYILLGFRAYHSTSSSGISLQSLLHLGQHVNNVSVVVKIILMSTRCPGEKQVSQAEEGSMSRLVAESCIANSPCSILSAAEPICLKLDLSTASNA
jgi:hypothetical protein